MTVTPLRKIAIAVLLAASGLGAALYAQIEGDRGVPPISNDGDFEVQGVKVDVYAKTAEMARDGAWREAQRKGWPMLWKKMNPGTAVPGLTDSMLENMVSGVVVEREQISANRYIATLGVLFDRARAGQILGVRATAMRSPPLLVMPIIWEGGTQQVFENRTEWQKAWARFRTGDSAIDYVRTSGTGPDPLLLNAAQAERRGRLWWRVLLDQYGAADVIMPVARLERHWPGGPVTGRFAARFGPDDKLLGTFALRVKSSSGIPQMMDEAVKRMDDLYTRALMNGTLRPDSSLIIQEPVNPDDLKLEEGEGLTLETGVDGEATMPGLTAFLIQFDTPDVNSIGQGEAALRAIPGVRSATTNSLALGGTSVMAVSYTGTVESLRAALASRGWSVSVSGNTLRIQRRGQSAEAMANGQ
ncbi:heavy-metal-associated domain-containing protein [Rhizorhapis sp. SPR117]|uniref:heavy-metal-associated domain-containing protein n=1 Tax=Rhizorhapis sp. SPR117 TaxID=2912611 RepID=UPI001F465363|nr:heavy-metal-associated domain-containing protein [Rhizorhapis sp. SPR117]